MSYKHSIESQNVKKYLLIMQFLFVYNQIEIILKQCMKRNLHVIAFLMSSIKEKKLYVFWYFMQSTKGSIQEDPASTKVKIGTPSCPSSELGNLMPDPVLDSMPETFSQVNFLNSF